MKQKWKLVRKNIKQISPDNIRKVIQAVLKDPAKVKEIATFSTSSEKLHSLIHAVNYELLSSDISFLQETLKSLKTKAFVRKELEKKGLPGGRNMLPDLFKDCFLKSEMYKNMTFYIFDQFLKKEKDCLYDKIEKRIKASSQLMEYLDFEITSKD